MVVNLQFSGLLIHLIARAPIVMMLTIAGIIAHNSMQQQQHQPTLVEPNSQTQPTRKFRWKPFAELPNYGRHGEMPKMPNPYRHGTSHVYTCTGTKCP